MLSSKVICPSVCCCVRDCFWKNFTYFVLEFCFAFFFFFPQLYLNIWKQRYQSNRKPKPECLKTKTRTVKLVVFWLFHSFNAPPLITLIYNIFGVSSLNIFKEFCLSKFSSCDRIFYGSKYKLDQFVLTCCCYLRRIYHVQSYMPLPLCWWWIATSGEFPVDFSFHFLCFYYLNFTSPDDTHDAVE